MTAQIVVMNTGGIALASDSAVTIQGKKVYNSADKLFRFPEKHTIGAMIYGNDSMFHVPWETLIKVYQNKLDEPFDTVKEYTKKFLQFLNHNEYNDFMADINEKRYVEHTLYSNMMRLYHELSHMNKGLYSDYGEFSLQDEIQKMYRKRAEDFLDDRLQQLARKAYPNGFDNHDYEILIEKYADKITERLHNQFENHLYFSEWLEKIQDIMILSLIKDFSDTYSGIIFAGYGSKEIYPSNYLLIIDGKLNHKAKYFIRKKSINHTTHGSILPFAQRDMIKSFLDGIHEEMEDFIAAFLKSECKLLTDTLIHKLEDNLKEESDLGILENEISDTMMQAYEKYQKKMLHFKRKNFIDPILDIVESLPVKELAHLAESLLNVASLKRKISISAETVGGPIDVAIITKGDGFTWMKRK